ncbi:phosphate-starvation-inducible PsiE family protein [Eupransor demetentiae]|uniref:Protein PsiE n=1 Tax=Eupransor demetentiae TaxID=3109584 RepID=A0ABP0ES79_9LACO|nr:Phosphate starvation-inducible membrane PsiE (function unknown) (PsiE) [Lactobacillaceae bacterium LMG 33000]
MKEKVYPLIAKIFDMIITVLMLAFGLIVAAYFALSIYELGWDLVHYSHSIDLSDVIRTVLTAFLCFEFAVIIKEYFQYQAKIKFENYLYVAITAIIRSLLVYHDNAVKTALLCLAILILVGAIVVYRRFYGEHDTDDEIV